MNSIYKCESCGKMVRVMIKGTGELSCCGKPMIQIDAFESVDALLDFAIEKEEDAHDFYTEWAKKIEKSWIKETFEQFAREELNHKQKLIEAKQGKSLKPSAQKIPDLKIADYLADVTPTPDMNYQQALIVAMKREKASYKLYNDLATISPDDTIKQTFLTLAQEEAKHKLRLETIYDEEVMKWD